MYRLLDWDPCLHCAPSPDVSSNSLPKKIQGDLHIYIQCDLKLPNKLSGSLLETGLQLHVVLIGTKSVKRHGEISKIKNI